MLGFLKQQEPPGGKLVTAMRDTSDVWCLDSRKTLFLLFFTKQESPGGAMLA